MTRPPLLPLLAAALAAACVDLEPREDPTRTFVLDGLAPPERGDGALVLHLGEVEAAGYLRSDRLVVRDGSEVGAVPWARWAEPLEEGVERAAALALEAARDDLRVERLPPPPGALVLDLALLRFEGERRPDGDVAVVHAAWTLRRASREVVDRGRYAGTVPWAPEGPRGLVDALAGTLAGLAAEVAAAAAAAVAEDGG